MENQTKNCQKCKNDFVVEKEDFDFYKLMKYFIIGSWLIMIITPKKTI